MKDIRLDKNLLGKLFSETSASYGPKFRDHYLKQYQIYVNSIGHTSDARQKFNSYFLTLNTLLLTALGFSFSQEVPFIQNGGQVAIPFIGIMICFIWWAIVFSYKQRSIVKQKIINYVEENLPLSLYGVEWEILKTKHQGFKYHFFRISLLIPWAFILLYVFIIIFSL
ncbi:hypothetical protein COV42_00730 [Candidatus Campbellbacteria bacterium CG11_big_fil_rev_8_21_14_0_20_44_21]|uniref:Uncharacterized protein n=1 Tax=Candidatus Campbellbacteria bacterium CG22_combo_CG10-13_8_21_14_all_43_18 TaxID=1974530 RepID=A0A2H0DXY5_9BACT|nr:MAG: hypothetical protein COW82_00385 [Candidatus Campbellbacteria bacterium CG22_combo_CG10-13_8_21_14_all_43_18]PIR24430.1 MAG: hypothetical protein COV42_00730 [Candidatus Campbellbacteria bacterium CG11_big_fil_rev_8_21_14_0_20_44_21]